MLKRKLKRRIVAQAPLTNFDANKALTRLISDYDYKYRDGLLYRDNRIVGQFRSAIDAAEWLCPIVKEDEYTLRLIKYTNPKFRDMSLSQIKKIVG